jgi:hypothetical protein
LEPEVREFLREIKKGGKGGKRKEVVVGKEAVLWRVFRKQCLLLPLEKPPLPLSLP